VTAFERAYPWIRPAARRDPIFLAIIEIICAQVDSLERFYREIGLLYSLNHDRAPLSVLESIGALLNLPRLAGQTREEYRALLRAQSAARASSGQYDAVKILANLLRKPGTIDEATVSIIHPEGLEVSVPNSGVGDMALYNILIGAIQETTYLSATGVSDSGGGDPIYLLFSNPDRGFGKAFT